jgi:hypothetical protein
VFGTVVWPVKSEEEKKLHTDTPSRSSLSKNCCTYIDNFINAQFLLIIFLLFFIKNYEKLIY